MPDCRKIEDCILQCVNQSRNKRGLNSLTDSHHLKDISRAHSHRMAHAKKIWHGDGVDQAGGFAGENVAMVPTGGSSYDIAKRFHHCWMNSLGHKENILRSSFDLLGVGVAQSGNYYYATQLFKGSDFGLGSEIFIDEKLKKKIGSFFLWWLTFGIGIALSGMLLESIRISNNSLSLLIIGFVIETVSKISQRIRYKSHFFIDRAFILWVFVHALNYWLLSNFVNSSSIIQFSLFFTVLVYGIWKLDGGRYSKIKGFIVWWITFMMGLFLAYNALYFLHFENLFPTVLVTGLIIEVVSKLVQMLRSHSKFSVDKWFLFWVLIMSLLYLTANFLMRTVKLEGDFFSRFADTTQDLLNLSNSAWNVIILSLIITVATHVIWKLKFYKRLLWLTILILFLLLLYFTIPLSLWT